MKKIDNFSAASSARDQFSRISLIPNSLIVATILTLASLASSAIAQPKVVSVDSYRRGAVGHTAGVQLPSRDFFLSVPATYEGVQYYDKTITVTVTPARDGIIHVEYTRGASILSPLAPIAGRAHISQQLVLPVELEQKTSGIPEFKAAHIWSDETDLTVNWFMSFSPSGEGTAVLPTSAWGTEYIVATYGSLYELYEGSNLDWPCEFSVVADRDNTICTITPTVAIRVNQAGSTILHPANQPFKELLQRGQCVQYQAITATNADEFDLTGTLVTSNYPVGVTSACQASNVPSDYTNAGYIVEMTPPVSSWGTSYYTTPYSYRFGGDTFLAIASSDNQLIWRTDGVTGRTQFATLGKYEHYFSPDVDQASKWESDKPFLLAQYSNGQTWPDGNFRFGAPSEVILNPVEGFGRTASFTTPIQNTAVMGYNNFATLIVNKAAEASTTLDGQSILQGKRLPLDDRFDAVIVDAPTPGEHVVVSDSNVGCYAYGYTHCASYGWSTPSNQFVLNSSDVRPPTVNVVSSTGSTITLLASDAIAGSTGIFYAAAESASNMTIAGDAIPFDGSTSPIRSITVEVTDCGTPGDMTLAIYDHAGNVTRVVFGYTPSVLTWSAATLANKAGLSTPHSHDTTIRVRTTITNASNLPFDFVRAELISNNPVGLKGLSVISMDTSILLPSYSRDFTFQFHGDPSQFIADTLMVSNGCSVFAIPVFTTFVADFTASNVDFGVSHGTQSIAHSVTLINVGDEDITLDSIWSTADFRLDPTDLANSLPMVLKRSAQASAKFFYTPASADAVNGLAYFRSREAGIRTAKLTAPGLSAGIGSGPLQASSFDIVAMPNPISVSGDRNLVVRYFGGDQAVTSAMIYNSLGTVVRSWAPSRAKAVGVGEGEISFDARSLSAGVYYYRVVLGAISKTGRLVVLP